MIAGTILMEDIAIHYTMDHETNRVTYRVMDAVAEKSETVTVDAVDFFNALAIAVHMDGTPCYSDDYPSAEKAIGAIRWIP